MYKNIAAISEHFPPANIILPQEAYEKGSLEPVIKGKEADFVALFDALPHTVERYMLQHMSSHGLYMPLPGLSLEDIDRWITYINTERKTVKISYDSEALKKQLPLRSPSEVGWKLISLKSHRVDCVKDAPGLALILQAAILAFLVKRRNILQERTICRETVLFGGYGKNGSHVRRGSEKAVNLYAQTNRKTNNFLSIDIFPAKASFAIRIKSLEIH